MNFLARTFFAIQFSTLILILTSSCGKLSEKFGRLEDEGYTRVYLQEAHNPLAATLTGGLMVYFLKTHNPDDGYAYGFQSEDSAHTKQVLLPNGSYKVYAFGFTGANIGEGQSRCGFGDGGAVINLSGVSRTVTISMDTSNCNFGAAGPFSSAAGSDTPPYFDALNVTLCSNNPYPGCSAVTSGTYYVKFHLLGGQRPTNGSFIQNSSDTISSACSSVLSGGQVTTNTRIPIGGSVLSPPFSLTFYSDAGCTSPVTGSSTFTFPDGMSHYQNVASSSSIWVDVPATSTITYIKLLQTF